MNGFDEAIPKLQSTRLYVNCCVFCWNAYKRGSQWTTNLRNCEDSFLHWCRTSPISLSQKTFQLCSSVLLFLRLCDMSFYCWPYSASFVSRGYQCSENQIGKITCQGERKEAAVQKGQINGSAHQTVMERGKHMLKRLSLHGDWLLNIDFWIIIFRRVWIDCAQYKLIFAILVWASTKSTNRNLEIGERLGDWMSSVRQAENESR